MGDVIELRYVVRAGGVIIGIYHDKAVAEEEADWHNRIYGDGLARVEATANKPWIEEYIRRHERVMRELDK